MKKLVLAAMSVLLLTGCDKTFEGTFEVFFDFDAGEKFRFVPGNYTADLNIKSKTKMELEVKNVDNGDDVVIKFKIPKDEELPRENGHFSLTAEQVGQPFEIEGDIATQERDSQTRRDRERCTYRTRHCWRDGQGRRHCREETHWGWEEVEYYIHYTDQQLSVDLQSENTRDRAAHFAGEYHASRKIYTYRSHCW